MHIITVSIGLQVRCFDLKSNSMANRPFETVKIYLPFGFLKRLLMTIVFVGAILSRFERLLPFTEKCRYTTAKNPSFCLNQSSSKLCLEQHK
jgi:hypothetical protein